MFTVAPSGTTKLATSFFTCRCCSVQRSVTGSVAALELVTKAVSSASRAPLKKRSGEMRVNSQRISGRTIRPWKSVVPVTTMMK